MPSPWPASCRTLPDDQTPRIGCLPRKITDRTSDRHENFIKVYEQFKAPSVIKGIEEKSKVKSLVNRAQVVENAKLPGALSDEAKEKQDKIWNEIKLSN